MSAIDAANIVIGGSATPDNNFTSTRLYINTNGTTGWTNVTTAA